MIRLVDDVARGRRGGGASCQDHHRPSSARRMACCSEKSLDDHYSLLLDDDSARGRAGVTRARCTLRTGTQHQGPDQVRLVGGRALSAEQMAIVQQRRSARSSSRPRSRRPTATAMTTATARQCASLTPRTSSSRSISRTSALVDARVFPMRIRAFLQKRAYQTLHAWERHRARVVARSCTTTWRCASAAWRRWTSMLEEKLVALLGRPAFLQTRTRPHLHPGPRTQSKLVSDASSSTTSASRFSYSGKRAQRRGAPRAPFASSAATAAPFGGDAGMAKDLGRDDRKKQQAAEATDARPHWAWSCRRM